MKTHLQSLGNLGEGVDPDGPDGVGPFSLLDLLIYFDPEPTFPALFGFPIFPCTFHLGSSKN